MSTFNKNLILSGIILASTVSTSIVKAAPFGLEARSLGMGNVSVATADIATSALSNPAMLSYQAEREDFSLLLGGGVLIDDSDGMIDAIDDFQASINQLDASQAIVLTGIPATDIPVVNSQVADINNMSVSGNSLVGKAMTPSGTFAAVVGFSFEEYSLAFSARNDVFIAAGMSATNFGTGVIAPLAPTATAIDVTNKAAEVAALETTIETPGNNVLTINGASITEIGLSGAKSFEFMGQKVSVGVTPKIVSAESFKSDTDLALFDTGASNLIDTNNAVDLGNVVTVDVGVVSQISESTQVGLVIKNLIEDSLVGTGAATGSTVNIARQMKVGVAYRGDLFTIGADLDLLETDPTIVNTGGFQSKAVQNASLGMEFNAWDVAQLRVGVQKNLADNPAVINEDALLTAGVGFWVGVNVDVAVIASGDTFGGIIQTGFKF